MNQEKTFASSWFQYRWIVHQHKHIPIKKLLLIINTVDFLALNKALRYL